MRHIFQFVNWHEWRGFRFVRFGHSYASDYLHYYFLFFIEFGFWEIRLWHPRWWIKRGIK